MPEVIKFSKGTVAEHNNFTGENGEITLICDDSPNRKVTGIIRLHDGQTVGGIPFGGSQLLNDLHDVNAANTIANQILTANANGEFYFANTVETIADGTISGDKIYGGTISDSVLKLKSSGDSIVASDGITGILSESGGVVTLIANGAVISGSSTGDLVRITQTGSGNALVVEDSANPDGSPFVIDASGNVGIGTSSPATTLDTQGLQIRSDQFWFTGGALRFVDKNGGTSERMRIDSSGNVGIGESNPDEALHVAGKIKLTGSSYRIQTHDTHSGADAGIGVQVFGRYDIRDPVPYTHAINGYCRFGFTSWNLNNTSPWADSFLMNSYVDGSGGSPNMLLVNKSGSGVKIARQGYVSTNNFKNGTIYTLNYTSASDERVKENVQEITGGLESILALRPVTFEWTDDYIREGHSKNANENEYTQAEGEASVINIPEVKTRNVGFIAQEVEAVIPTVVHQDNVRLSSMKQGDYLKNVSYEKIVPHLVSAIKEQQTIIESLIARISALETAS